MARQAIRREDRAVPENLKPRKADTLKGKTLTTLKSEGSGNLLGSMIF
jgi:hypothetical protein